MSLCLVVALLARTFVHAAAGRQIVFSPDAQVLATCSVDGAIKFWRVTDGHLVRMLHHPDGVTSIDFSRDGRWFVTAGYDHTIRLWRVGAGSLRAQRRR